MLIRVSLIVVFGSAIFLASCGSTGEVRPISAHPSLGQGRTVQLLQDDVQRHAAFSVTAPAGTYKATFENDDYVFYSGGPIILKHGLGTERSPGGLALSKRRVGQAFVYELMRGGKPSVLNRRVRAPMVVRP